MIHYILNGGGADSLALNKMFINESVVNIFIKPISGISSEFLYFSKQARFFTTPSIVIDDMDREIDSSKEVNGRNAYYIFQTLVTLGDKLKGNKLIVGVEPSSSFVDNKPDYNEVLKNLLTYHNVEYSTPLIDRKMGKDEVFQYISDLPKDLFVSCFTSNNCGKCRKCISRNYFYKPIENPKTIMELRNGKV